MHPDQPESIGRGTQKLLRCLDARAAKAVGRRVGDSREVGELQPAEHRDEIGVINPLQSVAFVQVGRLLGHPDRR
jgi:hypothetical protein